MYSRSRNHFAYSALNSPNLWFPLDTLVLGFFAFQLRTYGKFLLTHSFWLSDSLRFGQTLPCGFLSWSMAALPTAECFRLHWCHVPNPTLAFTFFLRCASRVSRPVSLSSLQQTWSFLPVKLAFSHFAVYWVFFHLENILVAYEERFSCDFVSS